jgi:hypothetical protein
LTAYFDQNDDREAIRAPTNIRDNDATMNSVYAYNGDGGSVAKTRNNVRLYNARGRYRNNKQDTTTTILRCEKIWVPNAKKNLFLSTFAKTASSL